MGVFVGANNDFQCELMGQIEHSQHAVCFKKRKLLDVVAFGTEAEIVNCDFMVHENLSSFN